MFIKIPFESAIEFKTNISEITKMSLEHDFNVNDGVVLGNFYISGEYRIHEVSVNVDPFNYTLPFTVELREDIKKDTVEFNIEDFSYEVLNNNTLKVYVEYSLTAEVEEELFERVNEEELERELAYIDNFLETEELGDIEEVELVENENPLEKKDEEKREASEEKVVEEVKNNNNKLKKVEDVIEEKIKDETVNKDEKEKEVVEEERLTEEEEKTIMETIKDSDDTFVTYHIHIVKESETIESIFAMYNVSNSLISEYNNIDSMSVGDKLLIPKIDE